MRTISLNHGTIELPTDWSELNADHQRIGWGLLRRVISGEMDPFVWQVNMLRLITGYRPKHLTENILDNLRRLAEALTFAFKYETDGHIELNYEMYDCPVQLFGKAGVQPHFIRERIVSTNMTAGMYADGLQLLGMLNEEGCSDEDRVYYMNKLARVLWRISPDTHVSEPTSGELLAVTVWFTGVALFFQEHDVYSVLFETNGHIENADDHISLGVQEIILELAANGRSDARNMDLLEFFDAQVKMLKDRVSEAKAGGIEMADLVKKTGLPLSTILRLQ